jgi:hypothetical protein
MLTKTSVQIFVVSNLKFNIFSKLSVDNDGILFAPMTMIFHGIPFERIKLNSLYYVL